MTANELNHKCLRRTQIDKAATRGVKRTDDQDDAERNQDRADDMSSLQRATHPGATRTGETFTKGEMECQHIGSGIFARTFPKGRKLATTTKNGPPITEVYTRTIRSRSTVRIFDECHMDNVSDEVLHRPLQPPDNIRVELTMRGAL